VFDRQLVTLAHAGGVAAVGRDWRGRAWLGDPQPGTLLEGFGPGVQGLAGDVTLVGGILPSGAVAARVLDRAGTPHVATCANGAWLALLPESIRGEKPLVRFLGQTGDLVTVPLPAGVRLEPVSDANEACPVCGGSEWARVIAPRRRDRIDGPTVAVCGRCGREEALGVLYAPLTGQVPDAAARVALERRVAREMTATALTVTVLFFPSRDGGTTVSAFGHAGRAIRKAFAQLRDQLIHRRPQQSCTALSRCSASPRAAAGHGTPARARPRHTEKPGPSQSG
jgi:hypothetical protein